MASRMVAALVQSYERMYPPVPFGREVEAQTPDALEVLYFEVSVVHTGS